MARSRVTGRPAPPALDGVPMSEGLRALAARGEPRFVTSGRLLIQEGDFGDSIYIILSGRFRAFSSSADGGREVTYGEYLPGEYLGELGRDGGPRSADVEALQQGWVVTVSRATLEQHIAQHPEFAFELLSKVIRRARAATLSLRAVALNDVYGRVCWLLNQRAEPLADGTRRVAPLTHQEMANLLACTRPMVSRVMKELEIGGYLAREGRHLHLLKALPARF